MDILEVLQFSFFKANITKFSTDCNDVQPGFLFSFSFFFFNISTYLKTFIGHVTLHGSEMLVW